MICANKIRLEILDAIYHPIYLHHVMYIDVVIRLLIGLSQGHNTPAGPTQSQSPSSFCTRLHLQVGLGAIHQDPITLCKDAAVLCTQGEPERARHVTLHVQPLC